MYTILIFTGLEKAVGNLGIISSVKYAGYCVIIKLQ